MKNKIKEKILNAQNIVILSHLNQDPDAVGSSFAMREVLRMLGKSAVCCLPERPESRLDFFGDDYCLKENIDKRFDLAIVLDCGSLDRIEDRISIYESAEEKVSIDHHETNTAFAEYNYVECHAAATGEILFRLFNEWNFEINDAAAMYLYSAIASDSGCFKYSNTSVQTMITAARLLEYGFDHADVCLRLFDTVEEKVIRLHGNIMNNIRLYNRGKIGVVSTDEKLLSEYGVSEKEAGNIIGIPRSVKGVLVAAELKKRDGVIRVSLRSNCNINVAEVAVCFGGGGHERAAGASIDAVSMEQAEKIVVDKINEICFKEN